MSASTLNIRENGRSELELVLDEAGLDHIVVDRCPHPTCEICQPADMRVAA